MFCLAWAKIQGFVEQDQLRSHLFPAFWCQFLPQWSMSTLLQMRPLAWQMIALSRAKWRITKHTCRSHKHIKIKEGCLLTARFLSNTMFNVPATARYAVAGSNAEYVVLIITQTHTAVQTDLFGFGGCSSSRMNSDPFSSFDLRVVMHRGLCTSQQNSALASPLRRTLQITGPGVSG